MKSLTLLLNQIDLFCKSPRLPIPSSRDGTSKAGFVEEKEDEMFFGKIILAAALLFPYDTVHVQLFPFHYKTVQVTVSDAETKEPIRDAKIEISYPDDYYFHEPESNCATTNNKGMATLRVAQGISFWQISLAGNGYFLEGVINSENTKISSELTLKLIKIPKVILIVPNSYVGPIKINLPEEVIPSQKSVPHREYLLRADVTGQVNVEGVESSEKLSVLKDVFMRSEFSAHYEDGKPIPMEISAEVKDEANALRRMGTDVLYAKDRLTPEGAKITDIKAWTMAASRDQEIYIVGNAADKEAFRKYHPEYGKMEAEFDFEVHDYNWGKTSSGFGSAESIMIR
jgi:hypothetical protein